MDSLVELVVWLYEILPPYWTAELDRIERELAALGVPLTKEQIQLKRGRQIDEHSSACRPDEC